MFKIWGRLSSLNVRKVVWAAQEVGVVFERIDAGGAFGTLDTAEYKSLNPNALVPLIEDHGFQLWESNVIVRYLAAKYGQGGLYPEELEERFDAERWMDWQQTTLNPAARDAFVQLVRTPEAERQRLVIETSVARTEPILQLLDRHLGQHLYLTGPHFTMADIPVACEIHRWWELPQKHQVLPNIERWYKAMRARPATQGVLDLPLS
jgi:glutathione S-transferase